MKNTYSWPFLVAATVLVPAVAQAQSDSLNRFTFSSRFGLNISAKFKGVQSAASTDPRTTPDGLEYNYDDGYVLMDVSGNFGGETWNWGYDSADQVSGETILMSRSTFSGTTGGGGSLSSDPSFGGELVFNRQLGNRGNLRFGLEAAANYQSISLSDTRRFSADVLRTTDAYPFTPGTTPPAAPYQGTYDGPGFVIGDTPVSSTTAIVSGGTITDRRRFEADLWGFRLGPYFEVPVTEALHFSFSTGLAVGVVNSTASWRQTIALEGGGTSSSSGRGNDCALLWGGYAAANLLWKFDESWSAVGGVQYQNLGDYQHAFGGRKVVLDLSHSVFFTLGIGYSF